MSKRIALAVLAIFVMTGSIVFSQGKGKEKEDHMERVKALKVAFLTDKLQLTSKEAETFWPVYNEYSEKRDKIRDEQKAQGKQYKQSAETITDQQALEISDKIIQLMKQETQLAEDFHNKIKTLLPGKKIAALYQAEFDFRRDMIKKIREDSSRPMREGREGPPAE
jgi:hypothetical protein